MADFLADPPSAPGGDRTEEILESLVAGGGRVREAGWRGGLQDFELRLGDGATLRFEDCLQVNLLRPLRLDPEGLEVGAWWLDEPSPLLVSLAPEVRHRYRHLVLELGEAVLRVAYRRLELLPALAGD